MPICPSIQCTPIHLLQSCLGFESIERQLFLRMASVAPGSTAETRFAGGRPVHAKGRRLHLEGLGADSQRRLSCRHAQVAGTARTAIASARKSFDLGSAAASARAGTATSLAEKEKPQLIRAAVKRAAQTFTSEDGSSRPGHAHANPLASGRSQAVPKSGNW
jgi:hypothetical protein